MLRKSQLYHDVSRKNVGIEIRNKVISKILIRCFE